MLISLARQGMPPYSSAAPIAVWSRVCEGGGRGGVWGGGSQPDSSAALIVVFVRLCVFVRVCVHVWACVCACVRVGVLSAASKPRTHKHTRAYAHVQTSCDGVKIGHEMADEECILQLLGARATQKHQPIGVGVDVLLLRHRRQVLNF